MNELVSPAIRASSGLVAKYMSGFGNSFETEALAGALPVGRNSPQKVNYGLYAEQLSGSPFTAPQATNQRTWLYRIRPTVRHAGRFQKIDSGLIRTAPAHGETDLPIGQLRWSPTPIPKRALTFVTGLFTDDHRRRRRGAVRHGEPCADRDQVDGARAFLQRRRRNADRRAAEQDALSHRVRRDRDRAGRDLRHPARRDLPRRADQRPGARLRLRELRRRASSCRIAARSAPIAWPMRAISSRPSRPTRTSRSPARFM